MKTKRDLFDEVYRRYGIQTSARFHVNLDEKMSDEDYQKSLNMYSKMPKLFEKLDEEDGTDEQRN